MENILIEIKQKAVPILKESGMQEVEKARLKWHNAVTTPTALTPGQA